MSIPPKRALLIGANYVATPSARLYGCIQDILNVQTMLITQYGYKSENITVLRDDIPYTMPTKTSILNALKQIVASSSDSSEIWIHYSGHGTQVADTNGDETDKKDEVIVPCDYQVAGYISDDVLFDIVRLSACRTLLFFDSCHSGSVCDLQYSIHYTAGGFTKTQNNNKVIVSNPNVLMMSGCRDEQTSADTFDVASQKAVGAFTTAFINTLKSMNYQGDVMAVYNGVCSDLLRNGYKQISVLSSSVSAPNYTFGKYTPPPPPIPAPVAKPPTPARPPRPPTRLPVKTSMMPLTFSNKIRPYYTTSYKSADIPTGSMKQRMNQLISLS